MFLPHMLRDLISPTVASSLAPGASKNMAQVKSLVDPVRCSSMADLIPAMLECCHAVRADETACDRITSWSKSRSGDGRWKVEGPVDWWP
jgi:hypothetical protein